MTQANGTQLARAILAPARPNSERLPISEPTNNSPEASKLKIGQQLTILAEALGETLTANRLALYAESLLDLTAEQLQTAFNRARRECKFFPKIAELRELAGYVKPEAAIEVEALTAFQLVIKGLEREGVDYLPVKALPKRTQYAIRQCGGLRHFNLRLDSRTFAFLQKDFVAAYESFDDYKAMVPALTEKGILALPQTVRLFLKGTTKNQQLTVVNSQPQTIDSSFKPKPIPQPMTEAQARDRKEMLRQQTERILAMRNGQVNADQRL